VKIAGHFQAGGEDVNDWVFMKPGGRYGTDYLAGETVTSGVGVTPTLKAARTAFSFPDVKAIGTASTCCRLRGLLPDGTFLSRRFCSASMAESNRSRSRSSSRPIALAKSLGKICRGDEVAVVALGIGDEGGVPGGKEAPGPEVSENRSRVVDRWATPDVRAPCRSWPLAFAANRTRPASQRPLCLPRLQQEPHAQLFGALFCGNAPIQNNVAGQNPGRHHPPDEQRPLPLFVCDVSNGSVTDGHGCGVASLSDHEQQLTLIRTSAAALFVVRLVAASIVAARLDVVPPPPRIARSLASLAFLAPDLVKAAIDGRLPHGMGVARLTDLPAEW
jgi:hypothetical protein